MTKRFPAHQIGAVFFVLWGLLHIVGGFTMMNTVYQAGGPAYLTMLATASSAPATAVATDPVTDAVFAFHAFNLVWIGLATLVIAVTMNWKNSVAGYWINLALVAFADLGLFLFLLMPGYMSFADGWPGPLLLALAVPFSTLGLLQRSKQTA